MSDRQHISEGSELIWVECSECQNRDQRVFDGKYITEVMAARAVPRDQWPPGEDWSKPFVNGKCVCQSTGELAEDEEAVPTGSVKLFVLGKNLPPEE